MTRATKATEAPHQLERQDLRNVSLLACFPDGGISHDAEWIVISYGFYLLVILLAIPFGAGDWFIF
jgi:hypothetical protein